MVYVLDISGQPLMPTSRHCKVRKLLNANLARVVKRCPFTIQMLYESDTHITQPISLGMDAGSKHIGIAATTETKVLYAEELEPRNDIVKHLSDRRQYRRSRRNRKTRYRQARFDNRAHSKHKGWLAPSVEVKIQEHISAIKRVQAILPIVEVHVETAEFDTQRLKAMEERKPLPIGTDYQHGEMYNEYNARQYVLKRDNYACQCCGKHGDGLKLHIHHKETRRTGGNAPNNLITLCKECHKAIHLGKITLGNEKKRRAKSLRDAAFMGIMRKTLLKRLRNELDISVTETYGYITKMHREMYKIEKSHINDAIVISKNFKAKSNGTWYKTKAVRHHNRQIHKNTIQKGGKRRLNQAPYVVKGFRLNDVVWHNNKLYFVHGRRLKGGFVLRDLDGNKAEVTPRKLKFINTSQSVLVERR